MPPSRVIHPPAPVQAGVATVWRCQKKYLAWPPPFLPGTFSVATTKRSPLRGRMEIVTMLVMNWRFLFAVFSLASVAPAASPSCSSLAELFIANTTITSADEVPAGMYNPSGTPGSIKVPAFCRVRAVSRPVSDSEIHIELWLPQRANWNEKFEGTGNGGFSSSMSFGTMATALNQGYATAGSDTGHEGGDLRFGVGHPEKINDWGYRAIHVMTDTAKLIIRNYYGRMPQYSYFNGCSTGGHQALSEAQRFPEDYDGIVAGDPGNNRTHLIAGFLWSWEAIHKDADSLCRPPNYR